MNGISCTDLPGECDNKKGLSCKGTAGIQKCSCDGGLYFDTMFSQCRDFKPFYLASLIAHINSNYFLGLKKLFGLKCSDIAGECDETLALACLGTTGSKNCS